PEDNNEFEAQEGTRQGSPTSASAADSFLNPENYESDEKIENQEGEESGSIGVRTPDKQEFFRASTDPRHTKVVYLLVLEGNDGEYGKKYYLLSQPVKEWTMKRASLAPCVKAMSLHLCINTDRN